MNNGHFWEQIAGLLTAVSPGQLLRAEVVAPSLAAMLSVAAAGGLMLGEFRALQRDQAALVAVVEKLARHVAEGDKNHDALSAEYRAAVANRDRRVANDDERAGDFRRRLDRIEQMLFTPPRRGQ